MRRIKLALAIGAGTAALVAMTGTAASASTGTNVVQGTAWPIVAGAGHCEIQLLGTWNTPDYYAAARITDNNVNTGAVIDNCYGWLERSTDGGKSWDVVSGVHDESGGQSVTTYNYWDGDGDLARACGWQYYYYPSAGIGPYDSDTVCTGSW